MIKTEELVLTHPTNPECYTHDLDEPTYVNFHSKSSFNGSKHSNVISNSYGSVNLTGLLITLIPNNETIDMVNITLFDTLDNHLVNRT